MYVCMMKHCKAISYFETNIRIGSTAIHTGDELLYRDNYNYPIVINLVCNNGDRQYLILHITNTNIMLCIKCA